MLPTILSEYIFIVGFDISKNYLIDEVDSPDGGMIQLKSYQGDLVVFVIYRRDVQNIKPNPYELEDLQKPVAIFCHAQGRGYPAHQS